jgi:V8-like Glu-specific endopeptidase
VPFDGLPEVGALFSGPSDAGTHFCTATVVHSPRRDLLVTAAHCLSGNASDLLFVPRYHDGIAPSGTWRVTAAYASTRWLDGHDPRADVAFLTVAPEERDGRTVDIEDVVGAARLAVPGATRFRATVVGYPLGTGGLPITCTNRVGEHHGYLSFACGGFVAGTSGGPFLTTRAGTATTSSHGATVTDARQEQLVGVIGGLHQGGCTPEVSYSATFGSATTALYRTATSGAPGDTLPAAGSDGC